MKWNTQLILLIVVIFSGLGSSFLPVQSNKTKLLIEVIDLSGRPVKDASIKIYSSEEDYNSDSNILITGKTDKKGKFQYKGLAAKPYFLDIRKDNLKNAQHSVNTGALSVERTNKFLVTIK
ncbi:transthyretin-like family protein [Ekhidna lutea]|nr:carboxypeptidase regulatory-like domain-containing protein [Ekhidna lutea]